MSVSFRTPPPYGAITTPVYSAPLIRQGS